MWFEDFANITFQLLLLYEGGWLHLSFGLQMPIYSKECKPWDHLSSHFDCSYFIILCRRKSKQLDAWKGEGCEGELEHQSMLNILIALHTLTSYWFPVFNTYLPGCDKLLMGGGGKQTKNNQPNEKKNQLYQRNPNPQNQKPLSEALYVKVLETD